MRRLIAILALGLDGSVSPAAELMPHGLRIAPLLEGMGTHHHEITTDSPLAQRYFDQGLVLAYGFNHKEAARSSARRNTSTPNVPCALGARRSCSVRISTQRWIPPTTRMR